jgi:hypothetical protein
MVKDYWKEEVISKVEREDGKVFYLGEVIKEEDFGMIMGFKIVKEDDEGCKEMEVCFWDGKEGWSRKLSEL